MSEEFVSHCQVSDERKATRFASFSDQQLDVNKLREQVEEKTRRLRETEKKFVKLTANLEVR